MSIAADAGRCPDQAQRASASQAVDVVRAAHGSDVAQTPCGQSAPGGQSDVTARHSQPVAATHASWPACVPHASLTIAAGTACGADCA
jgi:hypothetical protein